MPFYNEDKILADEMQSGSKAAFDKIYKKYAPALLGYIIKIVEDRHLGEKVLEQAFAEIWARKDKYDPSKLRLMTWMLQSAKTLALAATPGRKKIISPEILNSFACVYISDDSNEQKVVYQPKQDNKIKLYELYDTIIGLMHFGGKTVAEASQLLNTQEDKIKIMLRGAINKLKESNP